MQLPFFYEPFTDFLALGLGEASTHHAIRVLRMKKDDGLFVLNGNGLAAKCVITEITKKDCYISITERHTFIPAVSSLHIAIAFTKNPARIEWFLEKATEMGIQQITPLVTERSEKIYFKKERFDKILVSAMLQSQQYFLPKINEPLSLKEILEQPADITCIAHCEEDNERFGLKDYIKSGKKILILIGPEGDFTKEEIHLCLQKNYIPVSLGKNRLRTETAGLFACAVFNSQTHE